MGKYKYKFSDMGKVPFALEYKNIRLISRYSELTPKSEISLKTHLTNSLKLNGPIVGAPMHTAVNHETCISLGLSGNIGVLPKTMSIGEQVRMGKKIKRYTSSFITNPVTLSPDNLVSDALKIKKDKGFSTIPITVDGSTHGKLVGLLVKYRYSPKDSDKKIRDVMMDKKEMSMEGLLYNEDLTLPLAEEIMRENNFGKLLIVNDKGNLHSITTWHDVTKREDYPNALLDKNDRIMYGAAVGGPGNVDDLRERSRRLIEEAEADVLFVETAQADSMGVLKITKKILNDITESYNIPIVWGNTDNSKSAENLASVCEKRDAIKVGIGPGSICTTRIVTGAGNPQLTAVWECSKVAKYHGIRCIADGGIGRTPSIASGNIIKALAAGADAVMVGGLIAGSLESPGEIKEKNGRLVKEYVGMSSMEGLKAGGGTRYYEKLKNAVVQGKEDEVPFKGSLNKVIDEVFKNLKYSMRVHYNVKTIEELKKGDLEFSVVM